MKNNPLIESMDLLDARFVDEASPEHAVPMTRLRTRHRLRATALVACLCALTVLLGSVLVPFLKDKPIPDPPTTDVPPPDVPITDVTPPDPPITDVTPPEPPQYYDDAIYTAKEIGSMFDADFEGIATSSYQEVYVPSSEYLYLNPISNEEYLPIYQYGFVKQSLNGAEFSQFCARILSSFSAHLDTNVPDYEITKAEAELYVSEYFYTRIDDFAGYEIFLDQRENYNRMIIYSRQNERKMSFGGVSIEVDQTKSDSELIEDLEPIRQKLCSIFGCDLQDVRIEREYSDYDVHGVQNMYVYFYNKDAHPLNTVRETPVSEYIEISFDNYANFKGDIVSDKIISVVSSVSYYQPRVDSAQRYTTKAYAKRISLEKAEELLYRGYVFGGHSCPLCMEAQDKVDFEHYDFVGMTYLSGYDEQFKDILPFYVFYKQIGTAKNGNLIYAKTYVPAIEVSGYAGYFESQESEHGS